MPAIWAGRRRLLLVSLVLLGVLQAVLAVLMAVQVDALLSQSGTTNSWDVVSVLGFVLGIGVARWIERVVAEDLGQDYVFEQRHRLITAAIAGPDYSGSLGVTVTRASNDLTAVRNWISLGISSLVSGIPLILVVLVSLTVLNPQVGLAVATPLILLAALVPVLARVTLARARELRRRRGRMSAKIADTVLAGESIRASGAVRRELKAVDRGSGRVVEAAIDRAWITGLTRALSATAASLCTVAVVLLSVQGRIDAATVASTMMLLGVMSVSVSDLGRVVEYRQNYRAACRILAPLLARAQELKAEEKARECRWRKEEAEPAGGEVRVSGLDVAGHVLPELNAQPGERIRMRAADPHQVRAAVQALASVAEDGVVVVDGVDCAAAPAKVRRQKVGLASEHIPLERGSVSRLAGFRVPDATEAELLRVLDRMGLKRVIEEYDHGLDLKLKSDGKPWNSNEVMRLKLARALLREPELLILEGVDNKLDADGIARLHDILKDYPGVVLFSSTSDRALVDEYREWDVGGGGVRRRERVLVDADDE